MLGSHEERLDKVRHLSADEIMSGTKHDATLIQCSKLQCFNLKGCHTITVIRFVIVS
jgi:hypothetical protein